MLYKYMNPSRIDVLQNLQVRFTQLCELNDPFESALLVDGECYNAWEEEMERMAQELDPQDDEDRALLATVKAELREEAKQKMRPHVMGRELANRINKAQGVLSLSRAKWADDRIAPTAILMFAAGAVLKTY